MARKKGAQKSKGESGAPRWVVTFADIMSIILCFFVLLLTFSELDRIRFEKIAESFKDAFGVQREELVFEIPKGLDIVSREFQPQFTVEELLERLKAAIKLELIKGEIQIESLEDRIVLRMKDRLVFASGSAKLTPRAKQILDSLGEVFKLFDGEIVVAGHTDNVPVKGGVYRSNWELSADRAVSVVEYLLEKNYVLPEEISAVGYGPSRPLYPNDTPEHRAANRRVEIILLQKRNPLLKYKEAFSGKLEQGPIPR